MLFEQKLKILLNNECSFDVSLNHVSICCKANNSIEGFNQFVSLFKSNLFNFSKNVIDNYLITLLGQNEYERITTVIGNLTKSLYKGDFNSSESGLNYIKSQLNQISDLTCKRILDSQTSHFDESVKLLKLLHDPAISLLDKLLNNEMAQHSEFWIVPGISEKRCIIIFQGDFYDRDFFEIADLYSENGLSGSFLIKTSPSSPLARFLIKNKKISAYIQDTGLHHSSYAYENLRKSNLSEEEVSYVLSLPHNNGGDDAKSKYSSKSFINEIKQVEDFIF